MLELYEIGREFQNGAVKTAALDGITLSFRARGMAAVLGPSGSGKTTFLNVIGGIDQADCGTMIYRGRNTDEFSDKEWDVYRSHRVGFVFQNFNLIDHLTVEENISLAMMFSGMPAWSGRTGCRMCGQLRFRNSSIGALRMSYGSSEGCGFARAIVTVRNTAVVMTDRSLDNEPVRNYAASAERIQKAACNCRNA